MEQLNFSIPTWEFIEKNFNYIIIELKALREAKTTSKTSDLMYYRNKDLKRIFGLSDNTIYDYREKGFLPFTKLGDIYYYPVQEIQIVLNKNSNRGRIA